MTAIRSRPITTLMGRNPATGEWNDSLTGDYLWSNANAAEAVPDVMTPLTWSLWQAFHVETLPFAIPGEHPFAGNICGRAYFNFSLVTSIYRLAGDAQDALHRTEEVLGRVPEGIDVPLVPFPRSALFSLFIGNLPWEFRYWRLVRGMPEFLATSPEWCRRMGQRLRSRERPGAEAALFSIWREEVRPFLYHTFWMLRAGMKLFSDQAVRLDRELTELVGTADANALLSNLSGNEELASLGPVLGVARVARGDMSREAYLAQYGHRGPHEAELSAPRPAEDPPWLDRQLEAFHKSPVDVQALLARQSASFDAAWARFERQHPRRAEAMGRRLERAAEAARVREAIRSEVTRVVGVVRAFALRAGELTGLGNGVFFLCLDELLDVLSGDEPATRHIAARQETYDAYCALPPYPTIIRGRFDPFEWAADPNRRSDVYDANALAPPSHGTITGFAGAIGRVEGLVRHLHSAEDGDQLRPGEILVAVTTNVGWTPLFPRAAAIVTDVGAPLSHAAIVARELGIPAVVGCGDATMRLKTGDRVLVDGGRGTVQILDSTDR
jgi:pyruvate,water dikinase